MKIEEAMLYCLAERNGGMKAEQLCERINRERLHVRRDGKPVPTSQIWAVVHAFPETFVYTAGRIYLMI